MTTENALVLTSPTRLCFHFPQRSFPAGIGEDYTKELMVGLTSDLAIGKSQSAEFHCASGKGGIRTDKQEGDGATPVGNFPLRCLYYRPDRIQFPFPLNIPAFPLVPEMGWCDDPNHPDYNTQIMRPHPARHEELWREDAVYDIIIAVGYNDNPVIPGKGSAIFIHLARENYTPTEGCIALNKADLYQIISLINPHTRLIIPTNLAILGDEKQP